LKISEAKLAEFKELYKNRFGIELSDSETLEKATKLALLFKTIYRPITKKQYEKTLERKKELGF
jgi:hypothetical protein